jgi:catechol 2,3-dioxygenase-like lactoylglutathione lyase family enzyme
MSLVDGIDHVMIAVRDLAEATRRYSELGFAVVTPGGRHVGRGTENTIIRLGWGFIELIAIHNRAERAQLGLRDDGITDVLRDREGGYVDAILETHMLDQLADRLSRAGQTIHEITIERARPDGMITKNRIIAPSLGSARNRFVSLIQWQRTDPERLSPETQAPHANGAQQIAALSFIVNNMNDARAYAQELALSREPEEFVPDLAAHRMRCRAGTLLVDFLAAKDDGLVNCALATLGEGLFEVRVRVKDLAQAELELNKRGIQLSPSPGVPGGRLLPVKNTVGARIILIG